MADNLMTTEETLLAYSEWLDSEGLIVSDRDGDDRPHADLAKQFVEDWETDPNRSTLAGRALAKFLAGFQEAGQKILDALNEASK